MPEQPYLQIANVTKIFGKNIILEDINFNIPYGSIFGIIGVSGCGKTTLLRILVGFLKPEKGTIFFQAMDIAKNRREVVRQFGFAAQEGSFYSKLTVKENLVYFGTQYGMSYHELEKNIPGVLKLVELEGYENRLASEMSSGMQRRLDIACAIIHEPKILILDEPTENLDLQLRKEIFELIKKVNREKEVTIVMTSHLLREIEPVCSRIAILHNRRVQKIGTMESLKDDFSENTEIHVESFPGKYDPLINKLKGKNVKAISKGHKMIVFTKKAEFMLPKVMSLLRSKKEKLIELDITRPTLEEIFEEITKVQQNITLQPQKKMSIKDALSTKTKYLLAKILHKKRVEIQQKPVEEKVNQG